MVSEYVESLEPYIIFLYFIHAVISLILAVILTGYTKERFKKGTDSIIAKDKARLEEIENRSFIFKLLFRVSLHKNNRITSTFFMFLFNLSMPIIGYVASIWIAIYIKNITYDKKVANTNILNLDEFGMSFLKVERIFGEGSMSDLMTNQYAPKSKKLKALSSLSSHTSPANLKVIRQTLSSTDDEIRMFGYAILNKAEKSLAMKINKQLHIFNTQYEDNEAKEELSVEEVENKEERVAAAAKELAILYWEMVYTELSHESLKENFLTEVINYIKIAKDYYLPKLKKSQDSIDEFNRMIKEKEFEEKKKKTKKELITFGEEKDYLIEKLEDKNIQLEQINEACIKLYVLMGRVYMITKKYDDANTEFTIAQELNHTASSYILPYLAEIHFITGNYRVVNAILKDADNLELNATLNPIIEQWRVSS